jgi:hypothetical protein
MRERERERQRGGGRPKGWGMGRGWGGVSSEYGHEEEEEEEEEEDSLALSNTDNLSIREEFGRRRRAGEEEAERGWKSNNKSAQRHAEGMALDLARAKSEITRLKARLGQVLDPQILDLKP